MLKSQKKICILSRSIDFRNKLLHLELSKRIEIDFLVIYPNNCRTTQIQSIPDLSKYQTIISTLRVGIYAENPKFSDYLKSLKTKILYYPESFDHLYPSLFPSRGYCKKLDLPAGIIDKYLLYGPDHVNMAKKHLPPAETKEVGFLKLDYLRTMSKEVTRDEKILLCLSPLKKIKGFHEAFLAEKLSERFGNQLWIRNYPVRSEALDLTPYLKYNIKIQNELEIDGEISKNNYDKYAKTLASSGVVINIAGSPLLEAMSLNIPCVCPMIPGLHIGDENDQLNLYELADSENSHYRAIQLREHCYLPNTYDEVISQTEIALNIKERKVNTIKNLVGMMDGKTIERIINEL